MSDLSCFNGKTIKSIIEINNNTLRIEFTDGSLFSYYPIAPLLDKLQKFRENINNEIDNIY